MSWFGLFENFLNIPFGFVERTDNAGEAIGNTRYASNTLKLMVVQDVVASNASNHHLQTHVEGILDLGKLRFLLGRTQCGKLLWME